MKTLALPIAALVGMVAVGAFVKQDKSVPEVTAKTERQSDESEAVGASIDDLQRDCKPFPIRKTVRGQSVPDGAKWKKLRPPERGDDQFEHLKALEDYRKRNAEIESNVYCDTFETIYPRYVTSKSAFKLELVPSQPFCDSTFSGGGALLGWHDGHDFQVSKDAQDQVQWFPATFEQGQALEKQKTKLFRKAKHHCYSEPYRIPIQVIYKMLPRTEWRATYGDGSGETVPTIKVLAWGAREFNEAYQAFVKQN